MYRSVNFLAKAVFAVIAGGGHAYYPCVNQTTHSTASRVVPVRINRQSAETHVDHTDVVGRAIGHHPIKSAQECGRRTLALRVQNTKVNQVCIGRYALVCIWNAGASAVTAHQSSYVSAMAKWVTCIYPLTREVHVRYDTTAGIAAVIKRKVRVVDAGIKYGDAYARSVESAVTRLLTHRLCAGCLLHVAEQLNISVQGNVFHFLKAGYLADNAQRRLDHSGIEVIETTFFR